MKAPFLTALLLFPLPLIAQTTARGVVTEQNSGNKPIPGVQIKALGSAPEASDNAGQFQLQFASKKPGERIVVSEVVKKGYEIVNKDVINNWLIPADRQARTKIVMCPEGALARNTMKYYDISLAGLTKGYNDRIRLLQEQRDKALIDAKAFGEQAKAVSEQYENAQKQLEELAERFARENFDDCSSIHRQAFEAFSQGNIEEAIRILESVNSEGEIAKAKQQKEKSDRLESEVHAMRAQSDSVIRQNIEKLIFQADLYVASNRFDDADKTFETAALADTTYLQSVGSYARFLRKQKHYDKALRWGKTALAAARSDFERAIAITELAMVQNDLYNYTQAERGYMEALAIIGNLAEADPRTYLPELAIILTTLAGLQNEQREWEKASANADEALAIRRKLMKKDPDKYGGDVASTLITRAGIQSEMRLFAEAEDNLNEALALLRTSPDSAAPHNKLALATALNNISLQQLGRRAYSLAEENLTESLAISRELAATNPDAYSEGYAGKLNNLAQVQTAMKHNDSAEANQVKAIAIYEKLAKKNPQRFNNMLVTALSNLGLYYDEWRQYEKAERMCAASAAIYRELAASNPESFTHYLAMNLYVYGSVYYHDNKRDSADALFVECLEISRNLSASDSALFQLLLANHLMNIAWDIYPAQLSRAIGYSSEAIGIFQQLQSKQQDVAPRLSLCCGRMARFMLLTKQFAEAEKYARMSVAHGNNDRLYLKNLAHSLLYQGKYDDAKKLYTEFVDGRNSFMGMLLNDFDEFEAAGVTHSDVAKIRELLKTK
jgi:tetratricopeptide (TPR) repeat protein